MRGKGYGATIGEDGMRITPAYAGKSAVRPPLPAGGGRITPAYAGKSFVCVLLSVSIRDHPRVCGEKFDQLPLEIRQKGSPPRMRGKVSRGEYSEMDSGITPAYAGKRSRASGFVPSS